MPAFSLNGNILQNWSIIAQPRYWYWDNKIQDISITKEIPYAAFYTYIHFSLTPFPQS